MQFQENPSPNFNDRPADLQVDMLLLHYTGMRSGEEALARLCSSESQVSSHYLIEEDGTIHLLVPEEKRAWHAGVASWAGQSDINGLSIGIELVNPGHEFGYRPFPARQIEALCPLARDICMRHNIPRRRVLGHSDVAPARKQDPGELFPWNRIAWQGVGLWPAIDFQARGRGIAVNASQSPRRQTRLEEKFRRFGYGLQAGEGGDESFVQVVTAFQRHWRPQQVDGVVDRETEQILDHLLDRLAF